MTIKQTVEIPASRRLTIDVPPEVPEGRATILIFRPTDMDEDRRQKYREAVEHCAGLAKRLGSRLTSDDCLRWRREDKELEDRLDALHDAERKRDKGVS